MAAPNPDIVKVTMNLLAQDVSTAEDLAKTRHTSKTAEVSRAIRLLGLLTDASNQGERIIIESRSGDRREVLFP